MTYIPLAPVVTVAAADATGQNTGNWTNAFTPQLLPLVSLSEIYHMTVSGAAVLASAQILIRNKNYSNVVADLSGSNEWDPSQPAYVNAGDEVDFLWNLATASTAAPTVTMWLRYDPSLPQNLSYTGG